MSKINKILLICGGIIVVFATLLNLVQIVSASHNFGFQSEITTTPTSATIFPTTTATISPDSIGDTSGVISLGMVIVFIIVAGVIWGSLEYKK